MEKFNKPMNENILSLRFYHVEQAKKYAAFLAVHINRELTETQFTNLQNAISILKTLTTELYETKTK